MPESSAGRLHRPTQERCHTHLSFLASDRTCTLGEVGGLWSEQAPVYMGGEGKEVVTSSDSDT